MTAHHIESRLEEFIRAHFRVSPGDPSFRRESDLFESGYVDSVGVVELIEFVRHEFGVDIPEDDLLSDDFSSIAGISAIVHRLHAA